MKELAEIGTSIAVNRVAIVRERIAIRMRTCVIALWVKELTRMLGMKHEAMAYPSLIIIFYQFIPFKGLSVTKSLLIDISLWCCGCRSSSCSCGCGGGHAPTAQRIYVYGVIASTHLQSAP